MIRTSIFQQAHLAELKQALAVYAQRHRVVAENVANVESAGYQAQELRFEEYLRAASRRTRGRTTHPGHLPIGRRSLGDAESKVVARTTEIDNGINNVDIDQEMADLSTNDLAYRLATRLLSRKYTLLREAITGRVR